MNTQGLRAGIGLVTAAAFAAALFVLPQGVSAQTKTTVRLDWKAGAQHAVFYLGKQKGYYRAEGIDLDIISGSGSADGLKMLGAGAIDFAVIDAAVLVQGIAKGVPVKSIAVYYRNTPISVMWLAKTLISKPEDLYGKRLGSKPASATEQGFIAFATANKLDQEKIKRIPIGFGVTPLLAGQVDAMMGFTMNEPLEARNQGYDVKEMMIADHGVRMYGLTLAANVKSIAEKAPLARGFLRATTKAMADIATSPEEGIDALVKALPDLKRDHELNVLKRLLETVWTDATQREKGYGWADGMKWEETVKTLVELKVADKIVPTSAVFTNDLLK